MEPGEEEPGGVGGAEVIRKKLEGEGVKHTPEGSSFSPKEKHQHLFALVLLSLSTMKVKLALVFFVQ